MNGMSQLIRFYAALAIGLAGTVLAGESPESGNEPDYSPDAMERLRSGEVLVKNARTDESGGSVQVQALIHADVEVLWTFLASCDSVYQYVDGIRACEVISIEQQGEADVTILEQSVKKSWVIPRIDYVIRVRREPFSRVDFSLVEGELKAMEGGWRFEPVAEGLIVSHEIRVQPSFPVPRWLLRRSMRKDLPDMLACLRGLVDGSGRHSREEDLKRCPKQGQKK
jgi:ribosome-associated toxin RatA of RatAB toxin-antitoxin module